MKRQPLGRSGPLWVTSCGQTTATTGESVISQLPTRLEASSFARSLGPPMKSSIREKFKFHSSFSES